MSRVREAGDERVDSKREQSGRTEEMGEREQDPSRWDREQWKNKVRYKIHQSARGQLSKHHLTHASIL